VTRAPLIRGIRDKLVVAFSALIAGIALFVYVFFPSRLERQAMGASVAKAAAVAEMASYSLGAGLLFDDTTAVQEVLSGALVARDVAFLAVWDEKGQLVAIRGQGAPSVQPAAGIAGLVSDDGRALLRTTDVMSGEQRVGMLALGLSLAPLRAEVANARRIGAVVGVLILTFGVLAILAISTFVTRPLTAVAETVNRIAAGDLKSRAAETNDVETRGLVRAFNHMIDTLAGTQAELAATNAALEQRVVDRTAELQSLIDVAPQAIVAIDTAWTVVRWNLAAEKLFGWSAAEVIGKPLPFVDAAAPGAPLDADIARTAEERGAPVEVMRRRKDGSLVSVLLAAAPLRDREERAVGYIGILSDITERKRLENQLRQSQKMEAMGRLAGGIAHDFNNILTIITACTELLMSAAKEGDDRSLLDHIAGASARAGALTRQLLTFTRQQVVQAKPIDVGTVIGTLEPMLRRVLPANIRLTAKLPRGLGDVLADESQLEQVVMNLVMNASDAMPAGGTLDMELSRVMVDAGRGADLGLEAGSYDQLIVRDSGVGIDEKAIGRIFDPFFTTKEIGKGTGLGLATVYGIVTALGGVIHVRSRPGDGTTFTIHLPFCEVAALGEPRSGPSAIQPPTVLSSRMVLLVEDERLVRQVVRRSLEQAGYTVVEAADGEQALVLVAQHGDALDVVVTDMMMPGMSGRAFTEMLRVSHPQLGVVCISGYTESEVSGGPMLDENHVFLQKPFSNKQLLAAVGSVTKRASVT
jgi:PAS domain S-box-containing protein